MSQAGIINVSGGGGGGSPIETITGDDGVATTPVANNINLLGLTVANATNSKPVYVKHTTTATDSIEVQVAEAAASSAINNAGLSSFNSSQFTVDANGFVGLAGGGAAIETITGDSGSISGANVTIYTNNAAVNSGSSVKFVNSGTVSTLQTTDSHFNVLIGTSCGNLSVSGGDNVGLGLDALFSLTSSQANVAIGATSLNLLTSGNGSNTCVGGASGDSLLTGVRNLMLGFEAGSNCDGAESSNIYLNNFGVASESNTTRIGTQGTGPGQQNNCFIAGIVGVTVSNVELVTINSSTGQMGVTAFNPSGFPWTNVTGATQTLAVNNGYITDNTNVTYTLPASASLGDTIKIVGKLGITTIAQNANQQILVGSASSTVGTGGSVAGTNVGDCIELICITSGASTVYRAASFVGNLTVT